MRIMALAFAFGTALMLANMGIPAAAAHSRKHKVAGEPGVRLLVTKSVREPVPYWDSNIVPRYRYRPQDDRVDPYGPPVVPVIRYWDGGEVYLPVWNW